MDKHSEIYRDVVKRRFLQSVLDGQCVSFEDSREGVPVPAGIDKRSLASVARVLRAAGAIKVDGAKRSRIFSQHVSTWSLDNRDTAQRLLDSINDAHTIEYLSHIKDTQPSVINKPGTKSRTLEIITELKSMTDIQSIRFAPLGRMRRLILELHGILHSINTKE